MKMQDNRKGFTLIELIVVVVVLALLAAVAVPMISSWVATAEENAAEENARTIELALKAYMAEEGIEILSSNNADAKAALGRYGVGESKSGDKIAQGETGYIITGSKSNYIYSRNGAVTPTKVGKGRGSIAILDTSGMVQP